MRIYTGYLFYEGDIDFLKKRGIHLSLHTPYQFVQVGENIGRTRAYGVYQLCDAEGNVLPEYEKLQFSRSRRNIFWIEAYN